MQYVQRSSTKDGVQGWSVYQSRPEDGFKQQTKVHEIVLYALLEESKLSRLANQQIGPLDDDDGDEVRALRVFQSRTLVVLVR